MKATLVKATPSIYNHIWSFQLLNTFGFSMRISIILLLLYQKPQVY